jgi:hypothetical protein
VVEDQRIVTRQELARFIVARRDGSIGKDRLELVERAFRVPCAELETFPARGPDRPDEENGGVPMKHAGSDGLGVADVARGVHAADAHLEELAHALALRGRIGRGHAFGPLEQEGVPNRRLVGALEDPGRAHHLLPNASSSLSTTYLPFAP